MTAESPTRALGNNYGAVTNGRGATVALFHPSAAAHAASFTRGSRLKRRARTTLYEPGHVAHTQRKTRARVTRDSAPFSNHDGIFLPGALYPRRNRIPRPY